MLMYRLHILGKPSRLSRTLRFLTILQMRLPIPPLSPTIIPTNTNQNIIKRKFPLTLFLNRRYNLPYS